MTGWVIGALAVLASLCIGGECSARRLIRRLRAGFQWLITEEDEAPRLSPEGLAKFFGGGYDPELGWVRKPATSGAEKGRHGPVRWSTDHLGARSDPYLAEAPIRVVAVGDSYTFSRQVGDGDAWPALLGRLLGARVANFGVGNYGLDQALLRYRREGAIPGATVAIMGVVPETMVRIHGAWKHYSEYGNTFAFKPRFRLRDGTLELLPNLMDHPEQFTDYQRHLPALQARDDSYRMKFRHDMIRTPYLWHWLTKRRNRRLVRLLLERERRRAAGACDEACEAEPFRSVMERNVRLAGALYARPACRALFAALVRQFAAEARAAGASPVFAMFPQLLDLVCFGARQPYQVLLRELGGDVTVIDAADALAEAGMDALYAEDAFGGHYSPGGNAIIAQLIHRHVTPLLEREVAHAA